MAPLIEASLVRLLEELDSPEVSSEEVAERLLWSVVRRPLVGPIPERSARLVMFHGAARQLSLRRHPRPAPTVAVI